MIFLTAEDVVHLHRRIVDSTGGSHGVRSMELLESAVMSCYQFYDGIDLYIAVEAKAARMAYAICNNHPFTDGNKRAAVVAMLVMLLLNGVHLQYTQCELVSLGLGIADSSLNYEDIVDWIQNHVSLKDQG